MLIYFGLYHEKLKLSYWLINPYYSHFNRFKKIINNSL